MDDDLRNGLWNAFYRVFIRPHEVDDCMYLLENFLMALWDELLKLPLDRMPSLQLVCAETRNYFFGSWKWYQVYDFLEYVAQTGCSPDSGAFREFTMLCNEVLRREVAGYRFIGDKIAPIIDETALNEIADATNHAKIAGIKGAGHHLEAAVAMLADRQNPDYRNSIKESISAVESICCVISGCPKAPLGQSIKEVQRRVNLHSALEKGFLCIYGYTSDEGGIRHAILDETNVDFEDAKYMLVACSAFVNYLIVKAEKAGIQLGQPAS